MKLNFVFLTAHLLNAAFKKRFVLTKVAKIRDVLLLFFFHHEHLKAKNDDITREAKQNGNRFAPDYSKRKKNCRV